MSDLSAFLASELGGRVTRTDLRTGPLLRRTSKIVAHQDGISWECYVNAASAWLWMNGRLLGTEAGFSINKPSRVMGFTELLENAFERRDFRAYVWPSSLPPAPYPPQHARDACRRLEPLIEALELRRSEYLTATPDQIALWNRRPTIDILRTRIAALRKQFAHTRE